MDTVAPFVILLAIALLFWLVMIRPQQRRQHAMGRMQAALATGDQVMLTSGIIGVVRSLDEKTVELEVSEGVNLRVVRGAVGQVMTPAARDVNTQLDTQLDIQPGTQPDTQPDTQLDGELAADPADEPEEKQSDGTQ